MGQDAKIRKITVFNGSPKADKGNTQKIVDLFAEGARSAGAEVETIFLSKKRILGCTGCFSCWVVTPGKCVLRDDISEMLEAELASDLVVFATPVYADNVSGLMKMFLDRVVPLVDPHFEPDETGETRHRRRYDKYPLFGVISTAGYPEQSHFQIISAYFDRFARNAFSEVVMEIYRGGSGLLNLGEGTPLAPIVDAYKQLVIRAGREVVEQGRLPEATWSELEKPLVPHEIFIAEGNKYWDKLIAENQAKRAKKE